MQRKTSQLHVQRSNTNVWRMAGSRHSSSRRRRINVARLRPTIGWETEMSWSQKSSQDMNNTSWRLPAKCCRSSVDVNTSSLPETKHNLRYSLSETQIISDALKQMVEYTKLNTCGNKLGIVHHKIAGRHSLGSGYSGHLSCTAHQCSPCPLSPLSK